MVKVKSKVKHPIVKMSGAMEVKLHAFLNLALNRYD